MRRQRLRLYLKLPCKISILPSIFQILYSGLTRRRVGEFIFYHSRAWCKKISPCLKFPPHFCQAKWPAHAQPIGPDGTCVTKLSSINFARPCIFRLWPLRRAHYSVGQKRTLLRLWDRRFLFADNCIQGRAKLMELSWVTHVPSGPMGCAWAGHFAWQKWGGNFKQG